VRILRKLLIVLLVVALPGSAIAGDLRAEMAKAAQAQTEKERSSGTRTNPAIWAGASLFAGGMTVALYAFINNKNGSFTEFGEANAVNKQLGAAGISAAFAGGVLIFMGTKKARRAPSIKVGPGGVTVSKQLTW
jgi:hypothetical protein